MMTIDRLVFKKENKKFEIDNPILIWWNKGPGKSWKGPGKVLEFYSPTFVGTLNTVQQAHILTWASSKKWAYIKSYANIRPHI